MDDLVKEAVLEEFKRFIKKGRAIRSRYANKNAVPQQMLDYLYPNDKKTRQEIEDSLGIQKPYKPHPLDRLVKSDHLRFETGPDDTKTYSLTQYGRWSVIAKRLGLSFMELCILADAYGIHGRFIGNDKFVKNNIEPFYIQTKFSELFPHHIYSENTLRSFFEKIKSKRYAYRWSKRSLQIHPDKFEELKKYHDDFKTIENWLNSFNDRLCEIIDEKTAEIYKEQHVSENYQYLE